MRKPKISILVIITVVFAAFTFGFFLGRNQNSSEVSVSVPVDLMTAPTAETEAAETIAETTEQIVFPIDINQAEKEAFMALPGIGEVLAQRIVAYRAENGYFSAVEELMLVEGIGEKRMEEILDLITIGG